MPKFIQKPIEFEAFQFDGSNINEIIGFTSDANYQYVDTDGEGNTVIRIDTITGTNTMNEGSWVVVKKPKHFFIMTDVKFKSIFDPTEDK